MESSNNPMFSIEATLSLLARREGQITPRRDQACLTAGREDISALPPFREVITTLPQFRKGISTLLPFRAGISSPPTIETGQGWFYALTIKKNNQASIDQMVVTHKVYYY